MKTEKLSRAHCPECLTPFVIEGKPRPGDVHVCPRSDHEAPAVLTDTQVKGMDSTMADLQ